MISIRLAELRPGMVLARTAKDHRGRILLTSETEITDKHITSFKAWGVTEVYVKACKSQENEAAAPVDADKPKSLELSEEIKGEMDSLFSFTDRRHPAVEELFIIAALRKMKSCQLQGERDGVKNR